MPGFLVGPVTGFTDRMKGKGTTSSSFLTQVGKSSAQSTGGGNIFSLLSAAGIGNGADATDDTLMSCSLPANILDVAGRCITVQAFGSTTGAVVKTVQFKFGASALQSILVGPSGATGSGSWQLYLQIYKVSSNVQLLLYQADTAASAPTSVLGVTTGRGILNVSGSEVDTAAIPLVVTGKGPSTANTVLCNGLIVDGYN